MTFTPCEDLPSARQPILSDLEPESVPVPGLEPIIRQRREKSVFILSVLALIKPANSGANGLGQISGPLKAGQIQLG